MNDPFLDTPGYDPLKDQIILPDGSMFVDMPCSECDCGTKPENITFTITGPPKYLDLPPMECEITEPCGAKRKVLFPWDNELQCWQAQVGDDIISLWEVPECCQNPIYVEPNDA